ncbi:hypothetical protein RYX36_000952 [Vicia faba]
MGLLEKFEWANAYGKKHCTSLFWRIRAAVKRALKNGKKQRLMFQYDPSSYALNFDDGGSPSHLRDTAVKKFIAQDAQLDHFKDIDNTIWVYVIWVKTN